MEKVFNRLKGLRAERGLTQVDMAKLLGMNPVTYRKKENGERDFTLREVAKAQEVLEIDPQYYFFYKFSNQTVTNRPA
ncbi:helix-turn-helix transcriptional regulator [Enterococcus faecalis]|uniref:helix-turn-helix transcriptional regulator n=1 Tax=Enterococcus faecalis TaxID=1351 RepID=UPI00177C12FD|nr:helix-turn-helix transcriptional regulator [Enterococcus faecalis]MBD9846444.1 helix-turn-helix transcriptional regulator [Enterococcus faecalis]